MCTGHCEEFGGVGFCVKPDSNLIGNSCSTDCDCLGRYKHDYGFYISCSYSNVYKIYYEKCGGSQCDYTGIKAVATYSGADYYGGLCHVDKCGVAIMNLCPYVNGLTVSPDYPNFCNAYCYSS